MANSISLSSVFEAAKIDEVVPNTVATWECGDSGEVDMTGGSRGFSSSTS